MNPLSRQSPARTRKKPSSVSASISVSVSATAAAQLLLKQHGKAAKDESIAFFSALKKCQPDPRVDGQTGGELTRRGMRRRGGSAADELLSSEIGTNDYDWLLTPLATPLWSPTTSTAARHVSPAMPKGPRRARSLSAARSASRLSLTHRESEHSMVKPARTSTAMSLSISSTSNLSFQMQSIRTSSSSMPTTRSASVNSKDLARAATSPRPPATARSTVVTTLWHRPVKAREVSGSVADKAKVLSDSGLSTTSARPQMTTAMSLMASRQPTPTRRDTAAPAVTCSRSASQASSKGSRTNASTPRASSPAPQSPGSARRAMKLAESTNRTPSGGKARTLSMDGKPCQGMAAVSATRTLASPVVATTRSPRPEDLAKTQPNGGRRKVNGQNATPRRVVGFGSAILTSGFARTGSRKSANADAKHTDTRHGGAPALRKATLYPRSSRSQASRSRLGFMSMGPSAAASEDGSLTGQDRSMSENGEPSTRSCQERELAAAVTARMAELDACPSARYEAMLLRENPENLTWLHGCDGDDDGAGLVEGSLELFDLPG